MGSGNFKARWPLAGIIGSMELMQGRMVKRTKQKICPVCLVIYPGQKKCCSKECFVKYKEMYDGK